MIKAKGVTSYEIGNLWKKFGVRSEFLDLFDKYLLYSMILENFYLEIFPKGNSTLNFPISDKF